MKKKLIALILVAAMTVLPGCAALDEMEGTDEGSSADSFNIEEEIKRDIKSVVPDKTTGWIDSDIKGYFKEDTPVSLKDDFAAAANKELYLKEDFDGSMLKSMVKTVRKRKRELINDDSVTGKNIEEVRKFVDMAENTGLRNTLGVEPLRPYVNAIEDITTVEELYDWITDTKNNPLGIAPLSVTSMERSEVEPDSYYVGLSKPPLLLEQDESYFSVNSHSMFKMVALEHKAENVLTRLGYDEDSIIRLLQNNYKLEKVLIGLEKDLKDEDEEDVTYTREQIRYIQGDYPVIEYLDNWGFGDCSRFTADSDYIKMLDKLCARNLEQIKAMCILRYVVDAGPYLDEDTYDFFKKCDEQKDVTPMPDRRSEEEKHESYIFDSLLAKTSLQGAIDAEYVKKYIDPDSYDRLYKMTEDIVDEFRNIFANEAWLSKEGKKACLEKLDAIKIHVVYQDEADYSDLNLLSAEAGGNFLETHYDVYRFEIMKRAQMTAGKVDRSEWSPYLYELNTTQTNAFYSPQTNGIYILAGILNDPSYYPGMTDEELLSGIGSIVGHEITHGFDNGGVKYDKDGIEKEWLPKEDQKAFEDATSKVAMFYLTLKPYNGSGVYNGSMVQGEATADMGGVRVTLELAKKIPGFDYDAYFRNYAKMWAVQRLLEEEKFLFSDDEHPLDFYRINVTLSQFDEFDDTYDINEGDGMYVVSDKRIAVW